MPWVKRWGYEMEAKRVRMGIYRLKDGGFFLRARIGDAAGKTVTVTEVYRDGKTIAEAQRRRDDLIAEAREAGEGTIRTRQLWSEFAASLLEERVGRGSIESAATMEWWQNALEHYLLPAFGRMQATAVRRAHIDEWLNKTVVLKWMKHGKLIQRKRKGEPYGSPQLVRLSPSFVNGILRILRNISNAIQVKFDLTKSAFDGIEFLPEGRVYSDEEPNSLPPEVVHKFMAIARKKYPQHFFMILLGFVTGLRPSSMRALRRKGPKADIDWKTGKLQIRRSHSRGQAVMDRTKTKVDNTFVLPASVLEEARRHIAALPAGPAQESDLLFPTRKGAFRSRNVLTKPFEAIAKELGLSHRLTPRGMRRTFNDLSREVGIDAVVARSISGHQTEEMQLHYSTARAKEQLASLEKIHAAVSGEEKPS